MQYAAKKTSKIWLASIIIGLFVLGAASAGYYYFDEIIKIVKPTPSDVFDVDVRDIKQPAVERLIIEIEEEQPAVEEPKIVSNDEARVANINQIRLSLLSYFDQNDSYPKTIEIDDEDGFYCYRKNGAHFILGVVLDPLTSSGQEALMHDLDGDYYCGETVKKCADPVYCVAP
jgi:hypothetical protein